MKRYVVTFEDLGGNRYSETIKAANAIDASKIARLLLLGYSADSDIVVLKEV